MPSQTRASLGFWWTNFQKFQWTVQVKTGEKTSSVPRAFKRQHLSYQRSRKWLWKTREENRMWANWQTERKRVRFWVGKSAKTGERGSYSLSRRPESLGGYGLSWSKSQGMASQESLGFNSSRGWGRLFGSEPWRGNPSAWHSQPSIYHGSTLSFESYCPLPTTTTPKPVSAARTISMFPHPPFADLFPATWKTLLPMATFKKIYWLNLRGERLEVGRVKGAKTITAAKDQAMLCFHVIPEMKLDVDLQFYLYRARS